MRFFLFCSRPAVSIMTTSRPRARAAANVSNATEAGSDPCWPETISTPTRSAQVRNWVSAAARNVSAAPRIGVRPRSRRWAAIFAIEVVLPVPFTPTTTTTAGDPTKFNSRFRPSRTRRTSLARTSRAPATSAGLVERTRETMVVEVSTPTSAPIRASSRPSQNPASSTSLAKTDRSDNPRDSRVRMSLAASGTSVGTRVSSSGRRRKTTKPAARTTATSAAIRASCRRSIPAQVTGRPSPTL